MNSTTQLRKVLFVEDEAELSDAYRRYFGSRYLMAFAATGAEARSQLSEFRPEVVVLDLNLPDTDGVDLLRHIRTVYGSVPVVVTTAYASLEPVLSVLGMAHSGYLLKPYGLDELAERIDAAR